MRNGDNEMHLYDGPCVHAGTLGHLQPQWRDKFKKAMATIGGKIWYACWIEMNAESVFVIFEDGDQFIGELDKFSSNPGI